MKMVSQRTIFTLSFALLALIFGTSVAAWRLNLQDDLLIDLFKIGAVIFIATTGLAFIFWTVLRAGPKRRLQAALAGLMTATLIVPLPFFAATFKREFLLHYRQEEQGLFVAVQSALPDALNVGFWTYIEMTRASLAAMIASAILGYCVARFYPQPVEKPQSRN